MATGVCDYAICVVLQRLSDNKDAATEHGDGRNQLEHTWTFYTFDCQCSWVDHQIWIAVAQRYQRWASSCLIRSLYHRLHLSVVGISAVIFVWFSLLCGLNTWYWLVTIWTVLQGINLWSYAASIKISLVSALHTRLRLLRWMSWASEGGVRRGLGLPPRF